MKANIEIDLGSEEISYSLKEVIREIAGLEIKQMVRESAKAMVEDEVRNIIAPIVDVYLQNAVVGRELGYHDKGINKTEVDKYIKSVLTKYLNEPTYIYSKTSNKISERYAVSSGSDITRAERWIIEKVQNYADTELYEKLDGRLKEVANKLIPSDERLQEIIRSEVKVLSHLTDRRASSRTNQRKP